MTLTVTMPRSNPTALKLRDKPDLMCTGCHTQFQDSARAAQHSHHPAESEGSRCVSCHMPRIMDALVFRARTHQIDDIPNAAMTRRFGQEDEPECVPAVSQGKRCGMGSADYGGLEASFRQDQGSNVAAWK